ncbi:GGDEF domain-containing protein [Brevibacillus sp. TJ4]|uniref:GGDEF domain-containing protein n=1 Tax=Brevibacillus sp. TJ4 TaxID=3234853 RepID=UPI003B9EDFE4
MVTWKWATVLPLLACLSSSALAGYIYAALGRVHPIILAACCFHICFAWWIGQKYDHVKNQAAKDGLTNAFNRRMAHGIFNKLKKDADKRGEKVHFLFIDVNQFKQINDRYGHYVGDQILCDLSGLLRSLFRDRAEVFRWGGDEFLVIMVGDESRIDNLYLQLQEKMSALSEHNALDVTISVGHAAYPNDGTSMWEIVNQADQKMYQKKTLSVNQ